MQADNARADPTAAKPLLAAHRPADHHRLGALSRHQDPRARIIRLLEVLLHGGTHVGGWTAKEIHQAILTTFDLPSRAYGLNQLRYDLRARVKF